MLTSNWATTQDVTRLAIKAASGNLQLAGQLEAQWKASNSVQGDTFGKIPSFTTTVLRSMGLCFKDIAVSSHL